MIILLVCEDKTKEKKKRTLTLTPLQPLYALKRKEEKSLSVLAIVVVVWRRRGRYVLVPPMSGSLDAGKAAGEIGKIILRSCKSKECVCVSNEFF